MPKSIKRNYLEILKKIKKIDKKRHSVVTKALERTDKQAIMKNSDIRISKAARVANILEVTIDELVFGKKTLEDAIKDEEIEYEVKPIADWEALLRSLIYEQWLMAGRPERRKEERHDYGHPDLRKTLFEYP